VESARIDGVKAASADARLDFRVAIASPSVIQEGLGHPIGRMLVLVAAGRTSHAAGWRLARPGGGEEAIFQVCLSGDGWVSIGGRRHAMKAGHGVFLPAHVDHAYGAGADGLTLSWLMLMGAGASALGAALGATVADPFVPVRDPLGFSTEVDHISELSRADPHLPGLIDGTGWAWRLLVHVASDRLRPTRGDPIERAIGYIKEHFRYPVRLRDLMSVSGLSRSHLTTSFKSATGRTVIEFLTDLRMAEARRLLRETHVPIADIAHHVGYEDSSYFARVFHRENLTSPRRFRSAGRIVVAGLEAAPEAEAWNEDTGARQTAS
jgi:AraC family transcriptional regulator of arabinose operon